MTIRVILASAFAWQLASAAVTAAGDEAVPKTYDGANDAFKEGGKEIGAGFRSLGRGLKQTFTGQEAKEEYKDTRSIGEGFKDIGRGVAGGARATGEEIKDDADGNEEVAE